MSEKAEVLYDERGGSMLLDLSYILYGVLIACWRRGEDIFSHNSNTGLYCTAAYDIWYHT